MSVVLRSVLGIGSVLGAFVLRLLAADCWVIDWWRLLLPWSFGVLAVLAGCLRVRLRLVLGLISWYLAIFLSWGWRLRSCCCYRVIVVFDLGLLFFLLLLRWTCLAICSAWRRLIPLLLSVWLVVIIWECSGCGRSWVVCLWGSFAWVGCSCWLAVAAVGGVGVCWVVWTVLLWNLGT